MRAAHETWSVVDLAHNVVCKSHQKHQVVFRASFVIENLHGWSITVKQLTRRHAVGAALGAVSAGALPTAAASGRPLTAEEARVFTDSAFGCSIGYLGVTLWAQTLRVLESPCPGITDLLEQHMTNLYRAIEVKYPAVLSPARPFVKLLLDMYSGKHMDDLNARCARREIESKDKAVRLASGEAELRRELEAYQPTEDEIIAEMASRREYHQAEFASNLACARKVWRMCPDLVECEKFPEPYLSAYVARFEDDDPERGDIQGDQLFEEDYEAQLPEYAREFLVDCREYRFNQSLRELGNSLRA